MKIRQFNIKDADAVVNLWKECRLVVPWNDPYKDIQRKVQVDADMFLVGEISGRIVATVMGGYEGHRGWINYLAVSPRHRGGGLGRRLIEHLEALFVEKGCPKINLQVRETNREIIAFYEAIGYRVDNSVTLGKRLERDD